MTTRPAVLDRHALGREGAGRRTCSVIVPCRNERGTVEGAVRRTPQMGAWTELIFVVGGSSDGTAEEVLRCIRAYPDRKVRLVRQRSSGKAGAVREGFDAARGDVLMILDGDLTVAPEDLTRFYGPLSAGCGRLVVGSRMVFPMGPGAMWPLNRWGNLAFGRMLSLLTGSSIHDALCGTKALTAEDYHRMARARGVLEEADPFGDFVLLLGAAAAGMEIVEIPVHYVGRTYGRTQIRRFRDGWALLRLCLSARRRLSAVADAGLPTPGD